MFLVNFQELKIEGLDLISLPKLCALLYLFTIIPHLKRFLSTENIKKFIFPLLALYIVIVVANSVSSDSNSNTIFSFQLMQFIVLFWIIINHGKMYPLVIEKAMLSLAFGSVVLAILFYLGYGIEVYGGRMRMLGDNPNIIGIRMVVASSILTLAIIQNRLGFGKIRYLMAIPLPLLITLMVQTASRVAILAFAITVIVGILLFRSKVSIKRLISIPVGTIILILIMQYIIGDDLLRNRMFDTYEDHDFSGRLDIYNNLMPLVYQNPILGIGETGYRTMFGEASPHNVLLEVMIYSGIIGLILYLTFISRIILQALLSLEKTGYLLPLILLIPMFGFLLSGQILDKKLGWVTFAYIGSQQIYNINKTKENSE